MSIDFPCTFRNTDITLPIKLNVECLIFLIFIWNNSLLIISSQRISITIVPCPSIVWLVISEFSFVVSAIREDPSTISYGVFFPLTDKFHTCLTVSVSSFALLFAEHPPTWICIFICIYVCPLAVFYAVLPLTLNYYIFTIVLAFILISEFANSVFKIVFEIAFVTISIGINVLSFSLSDTVNVISIILITIWILSIPLTSIISGRVTDLSTLWSELIWSSTLLFCHSYLKWGKLSYK